MRERRPEDGPAYIPRPKAATLGNILADSIAIYVRHAIPILLVSAAVFLPFGYLQNLAWERMAEQPDFWDRLVEGETGQPVYVRFIAVCLQFVLQGFVIFIVVRHLDGRRPGVLDALSVGLRRMLPALGVTLLIVLCFVPLVLPIVFAPMLLLIMLIPICIVGCGLFVAIAASVMERPGLFGALGRSWELTSGRRGTIFLLLFVVFLLLGVILGVLERAVISRVTLDTILEMLKRVTWLRTGIQTVFYSFLAVCAAVTYHHLRTSKEGVSTNELAAIFD